LPVSHTKVAVPGSVSAPGSKDKSHYVTRCEACGQTPPLDTRLANCAVCGGSFTFLYEGGSRPLLAAASTALGQNEGLWKFRERLPIGLHVVPITLGEGRTSLLRARQIRPFDLYLKNEATNPTGSHKDRALSVAMTKGVEAGFKTCMLYSDGSAALSSAAYAARAGLRNITVVPVGAGESRLYPLMAYDSDLIEFDGDSADALDWVHNMCRTLGLYETSTYRQANPYGAEGTKTISYEIYEQLGAFPDWLVVAVGGGGTLAAIWKGFLELQASGIVGRLPKLVGVLPSGYRVLPEGLERNIQTDAELRGLANFPLPETAQVKISMRNPPDGIDAIRAIRESGGRFCHVSDEAAWKAQAQLGSFEGIYAELSATVSFPAIDQLQAEGVIAAGSTVVAVVCGSGFRETCAVHSPLKVRTTLINSDSGLHQLEALLKHRNH
jgi:threonine synthase